MKKLLVLTTLIFPTLCLLAQAPQKFSYQAVAVDASGSELKNTKICIRASVISNTFNGTEEWKEVHPDVTTDEFGLFTLEVGEGTPIGGTQTDFANIGWGNTKHFLKIEMSLDDQCTNYVLVGTNQFLSVPYALYAEKSQSANISNTSIYADSSSVTNNAIHASYADTAIFSITTITNINDNDPDPTNEIQNLSANGSMLSLSGSNAPPVDMNASDPDSDPTNEIQNLSANGSMLSLSGSNAPPIDLNASDPDSDPTNEIQNLSANGSMLSLSGSNAPPVDLNASDPDSDPTNEIQDLTFDSSTGMLSLTKTNVSIDLSNLSNFNAAGSDLDFPQGVTGAKYVFIPDQATVPADSVFYITACENEIILPGVGNAFGIHKTGPNLPLLQPGTVIDECRCIGFFKPIDPYITPILKVLKPNQGNFYQVPFGKNLVIKSGIDQSSPLTLDGFTISPFVSTFKALVIPSGIQIRNLGNNEVIISGYLIPQ